ncbi:MAG: SHOCT domain-containing protein [Solirubrobacteraceae bacterium]|nr:SHOCT domain-containing protein [Solirubrobacteraceae bacterium]
MLGLFTRIKDPVPGTAQVVSGTRPPDSATSANVRLQLVIQAEGIAPYSTELHCIAPTKKWPFPGEALPVIVSRSDPHKLKIDWDAVVPHADRGREQAEQLAAALRGQAGPGADAPLAGIPPEAQAIVAQLQQAFPGAQVQVGSAEGIRPPGTPAAAEDPEEELLDRLERLAALHERGVLTDAEFAEQKRRILDGP